MTSGARSGRADFDQLFKARSIPVGEPYFVLRAQDLVAAATVRGYVQLALDAGADPAMLELAAAQADALEQWPKKKLPDVDLPEHELKQPAYAWSRREWRLGTFSAESIAEQRGFERGLAERPAAPQDGLREALEVIDQRARDCAELAAQRASDGDEYEERPLQWKHDGYAHSATIIRHALTASPAPGGKVELTGWPKTTKLKQDVREFLAALPPAAPGVEGLPDMDADAFNAFAIDLPMGSDERALAVATWLAVLNYRRGWIPSPVRFPEPPAFVPMIVAAADPLAHPAQPEASGGGVGDAALWDEWCLSGGKDSSVDQALFYAGLRAARRPAQQPAAGVAEVRLALERIRDGKPGLLNTKTAHDHWAATSAVACTGLDALAKLERPS